MKRKLKAVSPVWWFSSFFMPVISQNVPVHHRWARGVLEDGIRRGEIMKARTACKEFRCSYSAGALPVLSSPSNSSLRTYQPNNRDTPSSDQCLTSKGERGLWSHLGILSGTRVRQESSKSQTANWTFVKTHCLCLPLSGTHSNIHWHWKQKWANYSQKRSLAAHGFKS